jgi:hypothetical protein
MRMLGAMLLVLALAPHPVSGLTVQDVVSLTKAGVSDDVVLTLIERDNTIMPIDSAQLITLKRDGVSERVVIAMLRSGRQPEPPPSQPSQVSVPAPSSEPSLLVVGHGPERPNTYHSFGHPEGLPPTIVYAVPYAPLAFSGEPALRCGTGGQGQASARTNPSRTPIFDAAGHFVNSTLYPMLPTSDAGSADCRSDRAPARGGRSTHR